MKKYITPSMEINQAQASNMLAESLAISETTVDGSQALVKENSDWNIWDGEE